MRLFAIDDQLLIRLLHHPAHFFADHFWPRYTQFKAFTTHRFNQHRKVQFTAPRHLELVRGFTGLHAQGDIVDQLTFKPLFNIARGNVLAFFARKGGVVDLERHTHCRLIH